MTPLRQHLEQGSEPFDPNPGDDDDDDGVGDDGSVYAVVATVVGSRDPGKGDGLPLGQRACRLGWDLWNDPEPTRREPTRHDTASECGGASDVAGLVQQTSGRARCAVSSTGGWWRRGDAGFAVQGIAGWSDGDTIAGWCGPPYPGVPQGIWWGRWCTTILHSSGPKHGQAPSNLWHF